MPIFNYRCRGCGGTFEFLLTSSGEKPLCPECGGAELEKLPSSFSSRTGAHSCANAASCPAASSHCCSSNCGCH